tara:strand:+ start:510 stop:689 length:180 start_codon:yes stop_codon:yes gene_type:complete
MSSESLAINAVPSKREKLSLKKSLEAELPCAEKEKFPTNKEMVIYIETFFISGLSYNKK